METLRVGSFETNSSSHHVLTLGNKLRPVEEFPVPDESGKIHLELIRNDWGAVDFEPSPVKFVDFLMLAIGMMAYGSDPRTNTPCEDDQKKFMRWLNIVYKMVGLPPLTGLCMSWTTTYEIRSSGHGGISDSYMQTTHDMQGNGLNGFLNSLAAAINPDDEKPWMAKVLAPIPEKEYLADVMLYNAALAVVGNSTGSIEGN